jgi:hypothetical protein
MRRLVKERGVRVVAGYSLVQRNRREREEDGDFKKKKIFKKK